MKRGIFLISVCVVCLFGSFTEKYQKAVLYRSSVDTTITISDWETIKKTSPYRKFDALWSEKTSYMASDGKSLDLLVKLQGTERLIRVDFYHTRFAYYLENRTDRLAYLYSDRNLYTELMIDFSKKKIKYLDDWVVCSPDGDALSQYGLGQLARSADKITSGVDRTKIVCINYVLDKQNHKERYDFLYEASESKIQNSISLYRYYLVLDTSTQEPIEFGLQNPNKDWVICKILGINNVERILTLDDYLESDVFNEIYNNHLDSSYVKFNPSKVVLKPRYKNYLFKFQLTTCKD